MSSYNLVDQTGLNYAIGQIALQVKTLYVAKADEKTALSQFTNDANYVVDASYVHTDSNYTATEKTKLEGIAAGAQVNVIETIKVNSSALTPDSNKAVDITVPTALSDLTNDNNTVTDASYVHTDNNYTTSEKEKLAAVAAGAQVNTIESVKVNGTALTPDSNKAVDITVPTAVSDLTNDSGFQANVIETVKVNGSALTPDSNKAVDITIPAAKTALSEFTNDVDFQTGTQVEAAIDSKLTSAYRAAGSIAFASLPALTSANLNKVYNITDGFTTTSNFVEGAGKVYGPGANVAIIEATSATYTATSDSTAQSGKTYYTRSGAEEPYTYTAAEVEVGDSVDGLYEAIAATYKYDVMADFVDLSGYVQSSDITSVSNSDIDDMISDAFSDD